MKKNLDPKAVTFGVRGLKIRNPIENYEISKMFMTLGPVA